MGKIWAPLFIQQQQKRKQMLTDQPRVSATVPNLSPCFWKNNIGEKLMCEIWRRLYFLISDLEKQIVISTPTTTRHLFLYRRYIKNYVNAILSLKRLPHFMIKSKGY